MISFRHKLRVRRAQRRGLAGASSADTGFTLPEVLIAMTLSGILIASISTAFSVVIRTAPQAETRLAESKDVTFLQTWIPVDLSTAIDSYTDVSDTALKAKLADAALPPVVNYLGTLPGTNVLTLVVPNADTGKFEIIAYRYILENGKARIARFRITDPGVAGVEVVSAIGVAYEIPTPPVGWVQGDPVDFAFEVVARNQASLRPVGEDIRVRFNSGNDFLTGGAGLSAERSLTPNDPDTVPDPTAPPSRCGGRVALVLDTSWSVPTLNGGAALESAATGFIDAFTGTPVDLTVMGFDQIAYQFFPNLNGARGNYFSLLNRLGDANGNGQPDIQEAKNNILALPNVDTTGTPQPGPHYYGSGNAAIGWTQRRTSEAGVLLTHLGGTNWEDALHAPFFTQAGALRPQTPELVVFVTDGDPNRKRSDDFGGTDSRTPLQAAVQAANAGRSTGARIVGVLVGSGGPAFEGPLAAAVGNNRWTGTGPTNLGNAVAADYFASSFPQLGGVLRSIMATQCGGTVTVRKMLNNGTTPATGRWNYSAPEIGDQVLDVSKKRAVTFDFPFTTNQGAKTVDIFEEALGGSSFVRADCEINGVPITNPALITQSPDGSPGVRLVIQPDQAVSCVMVSA